LGDEKYTPPPPCKGGVYEKSSDSFDDFPYTPTRLGGGGVYFSSSNHHDLHHLPWKNSLPQLLLCLTAALVCVFIHVLIIVLFLKYLHSQRVLSFYPNAQNSSNVDLKACAEHIF